MIDYSTTVNKLEDLYNEKYEEEISKAATSGEKSVEISFKEMDRYDFELTDFLNQKPNKFIEAAQEAMNSLELVHESLIPRLNDLPEEDFTRLKNLRSEHIDNFVAVEGMIKRATEVKPEVVSATFECTNCGNWVEKEQDSTKLKSPYKCSECGSRKFAVEEKNMVDTQIVVVEENPESREGSEQPTNLKVKVKGDLVDPEFQKKIMPGNVVHIGGVIHTEPIQKKDSKKYDMYMVANNIIPTEQEFDELSLGEEEINEIEELSNEDDIFEQITDSIAPSIYGHEQVKKAIALQLFGGVKKTREDGVKSRGDIHVLLIGEPGTGKSQLLEFTGELAPKGRYVVGKSSSGVGLTASVVKESSGEFSLEAGTIVLSHKGIAAVDEIDKMSEEDRSSLHEAMEQQQISISKANIQATLNAETTILAAGNPKLGRFDPYEPVAQQIEIGDTLLSRFDLIFPVKDEPDEERDEDLSEQILQNHIEPEGLEPSISQTMLRKYIAYSRRKDPELTQDAADKIQDFYINIRSSGDEESSSVPITARQLEALVRLSEASARAQLKDEVGVEDAERAIEILTYCMQQVGVDPETGEWDADMVETGVSGSTRNRIQDVKHLVKGMASDQAVDIDAVLDKAEDQGFDRDKAEDVIDRLSNQGEVYEPENGKIQVI